MKVKFDKPAVEPELDDGVKVEYAPAKRPFPVLRWYLILLIVASPIIYFIGTIIADKISIQASGFVSLDLVQVRSPQEGRLAGFNIAVRDEVKIAQSLVSIAPPDFILEQRAREQRDREQAQLKLFKAQTALYQEKKRNAILARESAEARILSLNQSLSLSREQLAHHKKRYKNTLKLKQQGAATAAETEQAKQQLNNAKRQVFNDTAAIEKEKANIANAEAVLLSVAPPSPVSQVSAMAKTTDASVEQMPDSDSAIVKSPIEGRVVEIVAAENQYLQTGEDILVIASMQEGTITAYLEAKHSEYAKVGQPARVRIAEGKALDATVVALPKVAKKLPAEFANAFGVRPLTIVVELQTDEPLPENYQIHGLPVEIKFQPKFVRWLDGVKQSVAQN